MLVCCLCPLLPELSVRCQTEQGELPMDSTTVPAHPISSTCRAQADRYRLHCQTYLYRIAMLAYRVDASIDAVMIRY